MTTSTDLIKAIARAKYRAQPEQLTALAREHYAQDSGAGELRGTYLRVLVAAAKALAPKDGVKVETLEVIDRIHEEYMPHLEAGVLTPDIAPDERKPKEESERRTAERHRRLTFARTSKSELKSYVKLGGQLSTLDPATMTRAALREFIRGQRRPGIELPEGLNAETKEGKAIELRIVGHVGTVIEQVERLAKIEEENPEVVLQLIQAIQDRLTELSDSVGVNASQAARAPQMRIRPGERRGDLRLWPSHP